MKFISQVKEASQRSRDLGLNYDFVQTLVADEFGVFNAVVKIIDRRNKRTAEWPTARLSVWLDLIRGNSDITAENAFASVDIEWSHEATEELNESLNSSRISLNLSAMKDALLSKPVKSCFKSIQNRLSPWSFKGQSNKNASPMSSLADDKTKSTNAHEHSNDEDEISNEKPKRNLSNFETSMSTSTPTPDNFDAQAQKYLNDLRKTTIRMKKLCHNKYNENTDVKDQSVSGKVLTALEDIEHLTNEIRHLIRSGEPTPRKTPKSVRFMLD